MHDLFTAAESEAAEKTAPRPTFAIEVKLSDKSVAQFKAELTEVRDATPEDLEAVPQTFATTSTFDRAEAELAPVVDDLATRYPLIHLLNESIAFNGREVDSRAVSRFLPQDHLEALLLFVTVDFKNIADKDMFHYSAPLALRQALAAIWREDTLNPTHLSRPLPDPLYMLKAIAPKPWKLLEAELFAHADEWITMQLGPYPHMNLLHALAKARV